MDISIMMGRDSLGPAFFDALYTFQVGAPAHGTRTFIEKFGEEDRRLKFIGDLIKVDLCLDVNNVDAVYWYQRALLLEAGEYSFKVCRLFKALSPSQTAKQSSTESPDSKQPTTSSLHQELFDIVDTARKAV
ncbi:hypothetical protein OROHE_019777 [Orobanche hederae]